MPLRDNKVKILHVVGARPNFMKVAPVMAEMDHYPENFQQVLVHTGQHYDDNMSKIFFNDLNLALPDEFLNVGSGTHARQTADTLIAFEKIVSKHHPDWVFVYGDVNSTLACALVCAKMGVQIAHVEAGLRSGDKSMPEEINRILTDHVSDILFTPSKDANKNLLLEGILSESIYFVGNVMIDSLVQALHKADESAILTHLGLEPRHYVLVTLHRPSNVDNPHVLEEILLGLIEIGKDLVVVFPVHPRSRNRIENFKLNNMNSNIRFLDPFGYLEFLALMNSSRLVITDSGGVQEETTFLGVPCLTVRQNTERPVTIKYGTNHLVSGTSEGIINGFRKVMAKNPRKPCKIEFWDAKASKRIVEIILDKM